MPSLMYLSYILGNDYNPSFFRKGKKTCHTVMKQKASFQHMFSTLSDSVNSDDVLPFAEQYVCELFGQKNKSSVDEVRHTLFTKHLEKKGVIDISVLPPCRSVLQLQIKRSMYIHHLWKQSTIPLIDVGDITYSG